MGRAAMSGEGTAEMCTVKDRNRGIVEFSKLCRFAHFRPVTTLTTGPVRGGTAGNLPVLGNVIVGDILAQRRSLIVKSCFDE